ncbi:MAG: glycosyltransferase [Candidatus Omnitrophica bacterium]|nr:glycosyltransferase [Candidatus Omnitrophota bacterium]
MRIALIFPSYTHKIFSENLKIVDEEFCKAPPIILAYVAAILERSGHTVMLLDAKNLRLSKEDALARIKIFKPDILGFRAETYHFHDALDWMGYLKAKLNIPVFAGGINLTLYPKETLVHKEIDFAVLDNGIKSLPRLIEAVENGKDYRAIAGIGFRNEEGSVVLNPSLGNTAEFNDYPMPARHLLPNEVYSSFISQRKNFTIMLASIGCPYSCNFCAIPSQYQARSPESVVKEIEVCCRDFNVREIDFFDAVFFMSKPRSLEMCRQIRKRKFDLEWSCRSRVDLIDDDILPEASKAGCRQIYYGIESADAGVLKAINKRITEERISYAIKLSKKHKIKTMGFFMVGNEGDTEEIVSKNIALAKKLKLDFIQVCRTIPKPGTELDKAMIKAMGRDIWREHVLGEKIIRRLPSIGTVLTEKEKEYLTKKFYLEFYFRLPVIWRRLKELKSLAEFIKYLKAGFKMLKHRSELNASLRTDTSEAEEFLKESLFYLEQARKMKVALVIPTYQERENIAKITAEILTVLPQAKIIIVDDGSCDGTQGIIAELARDNRVNVIARSGRRGLGLSYVNGFKFVLDNLDAEYIFEMDADLSHNPDYIPLFLHYIKYYEVVTGSRFLRRVSIKNRVLWRNIISKSTKWFVNLILGTKLTDVTTGFKCFRRQVLEEIDFNEIKSAGFSFQIEVSYKLLKMGKRIKEIPIVFIEREYGVSKMSYKMLFEGIYIVARLFKQRIAGLIRKTNKKTRLDFTVMEPLESKGEN